MANIEQGPERNISPRPGGWSAGWWTATVIVIALIIWAVGWGWNRDREERAAQMPAGMENPIGSPGQIQSDAQVDSVDDIVEAENKQELSGKSVRLEDVKVQASAGRRAFWVGDDADKRVLVIMNENGQIGQGGRADLPQSGNLPGETADDQARDSSQMVAPRQGQEVTISGTINQITTPEELQVRHGLNSGDISNMQGQQLYVVADQVLLNDKN